MKSGELMEAHLFYRLWLAIGLGPVNRRIRWLLDKYIFPEAIFEALQEGSLQGLSLNELNSLKNVTHRQIEHLYKSCIEKGIQIYSPDDEAFPISLSEIDDPPNLIFCYGNLEEIHIKPSIAIIGARDADDYAVSAAERISAELSAKGITIISGFARGIDSAAHRAALDSGGQTIAVLGCGISYDYPRNSRGLKERIAQNGIVISEYFPSSDPKPENFKIRNRIVSGLSDGILVIQAGERSGTLNTASHGLSQGKDIFVLTPHDVFDDGYKGSIGLLRDGAIPVYSSKDILNNLAEH